MKRNIKVIVCGGRDYRLTQMDLEILQGFHDRFNFIQLLSGNCFGADQDAEAWAKTRNIPVKTFIPNWVLEGKKAGPLRNQEMADEADFCICFPGGKGTEDMKNRAIKKGAYVIVLKPPASE